MYSYASAENNENQTVYAVKADGDVTIKNATTDFEAYMAYATYGIWCGGSFEFGVEGGTTSDTSLYTTADNF